jgi:hypothetical protein
MASVTPAAAAPVPQASSPAPLTNIYGRGGAAQPAAAQKGVGYEAYTIGPKSAQSFLSGEEAIAYSTAMGTLGLSAPTNKKGVTPKKKLKKLVKAQTEAQTEIERLREIANARALGQFETQAPQHTNPALMKSGAAGLISPESVTGGYPGSIEFKALGADLSYGDPKVKARLAQAATVDLGYK